MKRWLSWQHWMRAIINPEVDPTLQQALDAHRQEIPVLWLLGKTGAGKSSVVQRLTGDSRATIGNGFTPCTSTAMMYDHPADAPVMRFLDTRGLGEAHYDPSEDLAASRSASHALLLLMRVDDPQQRVLLDAVQALGRAREDLPMLLVHTALHTVTDTDLQRAMAHNHAQLATVAGRDLPEVPIDFTADEDGFEDPDVGLDALCDAIVNRVPELAVVLARGPASDDEHRLFQVHRREVLGYASAAAAVDLVPAVGLVAVPSVQGKLLHTLALRYGLSWDRRLATELLAALGSSFLYRYALSFMGREAAKFVPVYGQSAGAAAAASISFASTYAIGRAACLYFHRRVTDRPIDSRELQQAFRDAFKDSRERRRVDPADSPSGAHKR